MPFHQELETSLDVGRLGIDVEPQRVERLALGIADGPALGVLGPCLLLAAQFREHAEGVGRGAEPGKRPAVSGLRARMLAALPELPGRTVAGDGVLLEPGHRFVAHPGEIIVRMVVLAHMFEAEAPIFALAQPPLGGPVRRRTGAARPLTAGQISARPPVLTWLDPDAVENWRVEFHNLSLCGLRRPGCKLCLPSRPIVVLDPDCRG